MGFRCAASGSTADSDKCKHLEKYPWMRDVSLVKWPKDTSRVNRWKRLIRRVSKRHVGNATDNLTMDRRTRLCYRHFDKEQINSNHEASGDPTHFAWNNWGKPIRPRPLSALELLKMTPEVNVVAVQFSTQCDIVTAPDIGADVEVVTCKPKNTFGRMGTMRATEKCEEPIGHDYLKISAPKLLPSSNQTDLTMQDIDILEKAAISKQRSLVAPKPGTEFMAAVTESDERVNFYTGVSSASLLTGTFKTLESGATKMKYWRNRGSVQEKVWEGKTRPGMKRTLPLYYEFVMTLLRLRLDLPLLLLADLFSVSSSKITEVTTTWISYLNQAFVPALLLWPSQIHARSRMPLDFRQHFPRTRAVIDCTEFYIDRPSNKTEQYQTYSSYKSHNTYKCLVSISPCGAFNFVSDLWSGNVSDKFVTEKCGFLDMVEAGDQVMADRGFRIEDLLLEHGASLIAPPPPFTRQWNVGKGKNKKLNVKEIQRTRLIARLRIHVERAIQRMKTWRLLKHQIPASMQNMSSMIVKINAALSKLKGPLFYSQDELHLKRNRPHGKKPVKRLTVNRFDINK